LKIFGSDGNFFKKEKLGDSKKAGEKVSTSSSKTSSVSSESTGSSSVEKVAVSDIAREAAKIHEQVKATPDVRVEKVKELKEKIDNGSYYVSSDKIAGKIMTDLLKEGL